METRLLIGGEMVEGAGSSLEVEDPAREEVLATVGTPDAEQLDAALEAARRAARVGGHARGQARRGAARGGGAPARPDRRAGGADDARRAASR
jgi:acyl-CoA reductase-like NAD-dependent aldehyde dehydrogenase